MRLPAKMRPRFAPLTMMLPCALLVMVFLPGVNSGFWRVDNPLYAAVAKSAWESGSLWTLHAGDEAYFNKPPLVFWAHGLVVHAFGAELWAARVPSFFVALAALVFSIDGVRRLAGNGAGLASGIVLALTLEFFRAMHSISLDLWLAACITGAAWALVRGVTSGRALAWCVVAGAFIGAGLMVKPMIALAAVPMFAVWLGVTRERRALAGLGLSVLVGVLLALPWHLSMISLHGEGFIREYFGSQIVARVTGDEHGAEPWWNYVREIGATYWPWLVTFALGAALLKGERVPKRAQSAVLLGVVFTLGWIVMLSVSNDKAGRYLIPVYPLGSWVSGVWLARAFAHIGSRRRWVEGGVAACVVAPVIGVALLLAGVSPHDGMPTHWRELREFVLAHPGEAFWTTPRARTLGAQVYLMDGQWPRTAMESAEVGPAVNDLLIARRRGVLQPRNNDEIAFESDEFIVARIAAPWDGRYERHEDASFDDE